MCMRPTLLLTVLELALSVCPSVESELTVTILSLEILRYSENRF